MPNADALLSDSPHSGVSFNASVNGESLKLQAGSLNVPSVVDPWQSVSDDDAQLLRGWNSTQQKFPSTLCAHELIEAQMARTPESLAAVFGTQKLTYGQLASRTAALAGHLQGLGVGPGVLVGIHLERSLDMLVSVLGILRAGGTYVPLDPSYPKDLLEFMAEDAQLEFILTSAALSSRLAKENRKHILVEDVLANAPAGGTFSLGRRVRPDDCAYVIYTSGSTGKPKGVQVTHLGLVNFLAAMQQAPGCKATEVVLAVTTLSFDIAALELFLPLTVGAHLVVVSSQDAIDPAALAALVDRHGVTLMQTTPSRWRLMVESGWPGRRGLRALCGGEAMPRELADKLLHRCDEVWNLYGPTEATVWCSLRKVERGSGPVPIGRPLANTTLHVVDAQLRPTPIGTPGELCVGGVQLAKGYLGRPELTAEKFVPDPFSSEPGARLYRTGDAARYLPEGDLEFLGRMDNQVKIRGLRIELGEIESVLGAHPHVRHAAVNAYEVAPQVKSLVAYVVLRNGFQPTTAELRRFLHERLPSQMVPSAFVRLPELPLTANGKVNRRALPPPSAEHLRSEDYVAPRNATEKTMAALWQLVLEKPQIGIRDNFFELGGYSLLAARLALEINRTLNVNLQPVDLLAHPTIEALIPLLQEPGRKPQQPALIPIHAGGTGPAVFFTWHNARWATLRPLDASQAHRPLYITEVPYSAESLLAAAHPEKPVYPSLEQLAAPHVDLICQSGFQAPYVVAGNSYGSVLAFEVARQLIARGYPVEAVFLFDGNIRPGFRRLKIQIRERLERMLRLCQPAAARHRQSEGVQAGNDTVSRAMHAGDLLAPNRLAEDLDWANWEERWPYINRIWLHIMWHHWPRPVDTLGVLFRAQDNEKYYSKEEDFDGCLGWGRLFTRGVKVVPVPGDHYTMWDFPNLQTLRQTFLDSLGAIAWFVTVASTVV